jgi:dipeptidyl aminopeptidase/acylaminoacyl peptidase
MPKTLLFLLVFVSTMLPTLARPITHEDVWLSKRIGSPAVSPDGRWAVFSVTEPAYDKEEQVSDLWLVPTNGSAAPRRLTSTAGSEGGVTWSESGDKIAFTAKRGKDEVRQVYVMGMTGPGEARRVSDFPVSCANPQFTPDGLKIVFEALIHPGDTDVESQTEAVKAKKERKENVSSYEGFPIRHWDHWLEGRHPRPYLLNLKGETAARDILAGQSITDSSGFAGVPTLSGETLQATVSPDGKHLLFVAATNRDKAVKESTRYRLYQIPLAGGDVKEVPAPSNGSVFAPTFGDDGKLYSLYEPETEFVYNLTELRRQGWPAKDEGEILTADFDRSVGGFVVHSSDEISILAKEHGRQRIFRWSGPDKISLLDDDSRGVFSGLAIAGNALVATYEDGSTPKELVKVAKNGQVRPLSQFNTARAAEIDWRPFEEFWFTSEKGRKIHNWMVYPPGFSPDEKYPLVLFIHGGPHSTSLDSGHVRWSSQLLASKGYVVLLTDYTGSVGYGVEFSRAIQGDPLVTPGEELHQAVEVAIERYPFLDGEKVAASGASYGGHMVNWLEATSDRFKCLIGHAGLISLEGQWSTSDAVYHREINNGGVPWGDSEIWKKQSPHSYVENFKTPIMLTIGEKDYRVPLNQTLAAWTYLQRQDVPSKLLVYHQANHWIMSGPDAKHFWGEVHDWLDKYLKD